MMTARRSGRLIARVIIALLATGFVAISDAQAQSIRIFVASYGNDANDGSRGSPKRNFQAAHDAVAAGGEVVVLDTAGYGTLTISKSITFTVPPGVNGLVTVNAPLVDFVYGITINAAASDTVALRGLAVVGPGTFSNGAGIRINTAGHVAIEDCTVRNFGDGIVSTTLSAAAKIYVHNTVVRGCFYGLHVENNSSAAIITTATGCRIEQSNNDAVRALNNSTGTLDVILADCVLSGNGTGIVAAGPGGIVRVSNCVVNGNFNGTFVSNSGQILSRGNNTLEKNTNNNASFPGAYSAK
jgi:hypothetical protein